MTFQVQEIEGELSSRKQEEAKRRRDVQEIQQQIAALQMELNSLDETVDYQVMEIRCEVQRTLSRNWLSFQADLPCQMWDLLS